MSLTLRLIQIRERLLAVGRHRETYRAADGTETEMDRTGRVVDAAQTCPVELDAQRQIVFSFNNNAVAYSYWRAQELSLFWREKKNFEAPTLDFGCGDGFFSSNIFKTIDVGVDIDRTALAIAFDYHIYNRLVTFDQMRIDLQASSIGTVFSCSVLEHTDDLKTCLAEIARVLKPRGKLYFTVPTPYFTEHMAVLADRRFADSMNARMYHRNLLSEQEWRRELENVGLGVIRIMEFQPLKFTERYFKISLLGNRTVGRIPGFREWYWRRYRGELMDDVAQSIQGNVKDGANCFIIAEKAAE